MTGTTITRPVRDDGTVWVPPSTIGINEVNADVGTRECDPEAAFGSAGKAPWEDSDSDAESDSADIKSSKDSGSEDGTEEESVGRVKEAEIEEFDRFVDDFEGYSESYNGTETPGQDNKPNLAKEMTPMTPTPPPTGTRRRERPDSAQLREPATMC